jgi:hypothetical protein
VRHDDAVELELLLVIGARDAVGAHHSAAADLQADHQELPVLEAQSCAAGGPEADQLAAPVMNLRHALGRVARHVRSVLDPAAHAVAWSAARK